MRKLFAAAACLLAMAGPMTAQTGNCHLTATQTATQMGAGINLGNTLESGRQEHNFTNKGGLGAETAWQSTKTTQAIIDFFRDQGFKSVRIPCAWVMGHISDAATYKIDSRWMKRVRQVVDYCINDSLYVVLNDHWDGGWLENHINATGEEKEKNKKILAALWTQIAEEFKDYDHHLLFAGLNEPNAENQANTDNLLEYEQVFIDAVRATGGNNSERVLVVQGPSTNIGHTCSFVKKMPNDTAPDRLMIEVHYYNPWQFWGMEQDESWGNCFYYWGKDNHVAGSKHNPNWDCEESDMKRQITQMQRNFAAKGIPVLIGELGANWRNLSGKVGESQEKHDASIHLYYKLIYQYALEHGMVPMAWDTNYCNYGMTFLDRKNRKVYNPLIMEAINEAITATGMETIRPDAPAASDKCYDLHGRPINPAAMQHGIYIKNGKKFVK